jgi:hypothetical protein
MTRAAMSIWSVAAIGISTPSGVGAQGTSPTPAAVAGAEQNYNEGVAATERGDFAAARRAFQASYDLNPLPDVLFNVAMCHKALGDLPAAANAFRDYVAVVGGDLSPEEQAEFDALLAELMPQIGRVVVEGAPPDSVLSIDGVNAGSVPPGGWVAVSPGRHRVLVEREGSTSFAADVDVAVGQIVTVSTSLVGPGSLPPDPRTGIPATGGRGQEDEGLSPWFWTCVGLAGASVLTMAITGGLTLKYNDDFDASGRADGGLRDTTLALRTTTDVFLGIGLAAVVVGTILFFLAPEAESQPDAILAAVAFATSGLVVRW